MWTKEKKEKKQQIKQKSDTGTYVAEDGSSKGTMFPK